MIRMNAEDLIDALNASFVRGVRQGETYTEQRVRESTQALLDENNKLKQELVSLETRVMAAGQKASFMDVRAERMRIVQGITKILKPKVATDLIFKLALGNL